MNHIFKLDLNWKPAKLPNLNMLEGQIKNQEARFRGALYEHGDFELAQSVMCHKIPLIELYTRTCKWQEKTKKKRITYTC